MVDLDQSSSAHVFSRVTYHTPSNLQADVNIRLLEEGRGGETPLLLSPHSDLEQDRSGVCRVTVKVYNNVRGTSTPTHWQCAASLHCRGFPHSLPDH